MPHRPQHSSYWAPPKIYGAAARYTIPDNGLAKIDEQRFKVVQQVVGGVLYYGHAVDSTVLPGLGSIANGQARATVTNKKKIRQLLD